MNKKTINNLFEETKDLKIRGERISGEPEIVHEIEDYFRETEFYPIGRKQIRVILEASPSIFPYDWKSPRSLKGFDKEQREAYDMIADSGFTACPGPVIEKVISLAIEYKRRYCKG